MIEGVQPVTRKAAEWAPSIEIRSRRGDSNSHPTVYKSPERVISTAISCHSVFGRPAFVPPCDSGCRFCRGTRRGKRRPLWRVPVLAVVPAPGLRSANWWPSCHRPSSFGTPQPQGPNEPRVSLPEPVANGAPRLVVFQAPHCQPARQRTTSHPRQRGKPSLRSPWRPGCRCSPGRASRCWAGIRP